VALQLARGKSPVNEMIYALPRAYQAALKPTTKRLRQNYKRLDEIDLLNVSDALSQSARSLRCGGVIVTLQ